jgi:hypothetical protein
MKDALTVEQFLDDLKDRIDQHLYDNHDESVTTLRISYPLTETLPDGVPEALKAHYLELGWDTVTVGPTTIEFEVTNL